MDQELRQERRSRHLLVVRHLADDVIDARRALRNGRLPASKFEEVLCQVPAQSRRLDRPHWLTPIALSGSCVLRWWPHCLAAPFHSLCHSRPAGAAACFLSRPGDARPSCPSQVDRRSSTPPPNCGEARNSMRSCWPLATLCLARRRTATSRRALRQEAQTG